MKTTKIGYHPIPLAIKLFGGFLGLFGLLFAFSSYFNPAQISPSAILDNAATRLAFFTVGSTVFALSVGLFLAIFSNRPKSMALMLIVRVVAALQDLMIAIVLSMGLGLIAYQIMVSVLGIASIVKLFSIIRASEKREASQ